MQIQLALARANWGIVMHSTFFDPQQFVDFFPSSFYVGVCEGADWRLTSHNRAFRDFFRPPEKKARAPGETGGPPNPGNQPWRVNRERQ